MATVDTLKPKFIKPIVITFSVIAILPLLTIIYYLLFHDADGGNTFELATILKTLSTTILLMIGTSTIAILIGTILALFINKCEFHGKKYIEWIVLLPTVIPKFAVVLFILWAYHWRDGILNFAIFKPGQLSSASLILGMTLYPYTYIQVSEAIRKQPKNIDEAALTLNSSKLAYLFKIIVPNIMPAIAASTLVIFIYLINDYGSVSALSINTLSTLVYLQYTTYFSLYNALLISILPMTMILVLVMIDIKFIKKATKLSSTKNIKHIYLWKLKPWIPISIVSIIMLFTTIFPIGSLIVIGLREIINNGFDDALKSATINTLWMGLIVSIIGVAISFVLSYARVFGTKREQLLSRTSLISYSISGVTLGIIWIIFGLNFLKMFYGTSIILFLALLLKNIVHSQNVITTGLENRPKKIEEASMVLGRSRTNTFFNITVLSSIPTMMTAFIMIFIHISSDLNLTLLLKPNNVEYLSTYIWYQHTHAFSFAAMTPAALLLVLLSSGLHILKGVINNESNKKNKSKS